MNMEHHLHKIEVFLDKAIKHKLQDWPLPIETGVPQNSYIRETDLEPPSKWMKFDSTVARMNQR